ncbi:lipopolysaccharide-induced tumor necrosis factor-alpha factor homolog [Drosophila grimshawi]|uniref:lipopolysaccharide-induced tumor necrosis factor-alpha factor homolog n=1 Tax=Drosophila grimshawi TaxID=7222 RepID=UPI000C86ED61|nr:lipopolysaccharide-induced tumor necrosis factor-alpha factor homolog [Drosophila grimshawi]
MEKTDPPPYTQQPMPQEQTLPPIASTQPPISVTPAQTYQPYPGGPTQPPLYPPMAQQSGPTTVVIHTTHTRPLVPVGTDPQFLRCPFCQNDVVTTIHKAPTLTTHMWAMGLCLIGCWPCVCIPYCMDTCKSTDHYCPVCKALVGQRVLNL